MSEGGQPEKTEKNREETPLSFDIMSYLGQAGMENLDPLTRWVLMQEMLDDWRERRMQKRNPLTPESIAKIIDETLEKRLGKNRENDFEKIIEKMNETWEKRFLEYQNKVEAYQNRIEALIMGRKIEEAEKRAEEAEKKLKEIEAARQQEELIKAKIAEATAPLQNRIKELQNLIAQKTAEMTNEEKKSFFNRLGEEIEKTIGEEVTGAIAGTIKESLLKTFSGKEEAPVTPEGKINWGKMADKWISKTLDTLNALISRLPPKTPPQRQITPIPETAPQTVTASIQQPTATSIQPQTTITQPTETITVTAQPETISQKTAEEAKEIKEAVAEETTEEETVEGSVSEEGSEATGESSGSEEPQ